MGSTTVDERCFCDHDLLDTVDADRLFRTLAHPCRREVLCLLDLDPVWTRAELAERLVTVDAVGTDIDESRLEASLIHQHLPIMAEAELVTLDEEVWVVERGDHFQEVRDMVAAMARVASESGDCA